MIHSWIGVVAVMGVLLVLGLSCVVFPVNIIKFAMLALRVASLNLLGEEDFPPVLRDQLRLIDADRREFTRRFAPAVVVTRLIGLVSSLMFAVILVMVLIAVILPPASPRSFIHGQILANDASGSPASALATHSRFPELP